VTKLNLGYTLGLNRGATGKTRSARENIVEADAEGGSASVATVAGYTTSRGSSLFGGTPISFEIPLARKTGILG